MQTHFSYQNTDKDCGVKLEGYATEEKLQNLTRLLQHGNYDLADLDIRVEYFSHHNSFEIKMNLKIARHILVSEQTGYDLFEVFDLALEKIIEQMRKLESKRHKR